MESKLAWSQAYVASSLPGWQHATANNCSYGRNCLQSIEAKFFEFTIKAQESQCLQGDVLGTDAAWSAHFQTNPRKARG
jgi:hypothetical protein